MTKKRKKKQIPKSMPRKTPLPAQSLPVTRPSTQQTSVSDKKQLLQLIQDLEKTRGNRVIVYWLPPTARMSEAVVTSFYDHLTAIGKQKAIDLVLFTHGGDTEIPWRLVTLIREFCDKFSVLIPYRAYSGGTLLAMGADEIVMTPLSVLGPIDPTRTHPLLPKREGAAEAEPISVQDMRHAMRFISETALPGEGTQYTPEAMAEIVTALFDKIHPLAIGAIEQSYALAKLIGIKCLSSHMDPVKDKKKIEEIVNTLCDEYKSHAYQISRKEAKEIGLKAVDAKAAEDAAMTSILKFYLARDQGIPAKPIVSQNFKMIIAWLESLALQLRCEAEAQIDQDKKIKVLRDRWVPY